MKTKLILFFVAVSGLIGLLLLWQGSASLPVPDKQLNEENVASAVIPTEQTKQESVPEVAVVPNKDNPVGRYDAFAQCLKEKGAMFYGASWCSHCNDQKARFGDSAKFLPYVECAGADNSRTEACSEAGITAYPTWKFADGTTQLGGMSMPDLAQKTGCALPE